MMWQRSVVREFHRQHTGLYFVVLLLAGCLMSGREHLALAQALMAKPTGLAWVGVLWTAFGGLIYVFIRKLLRQPSYEFLYHTALLSTKIKLYELVAAQATMLSLPIGYGLFMMAVGFQQHAWLSIGAVAGLLLLITTAGTMLTLRLLQHPPLPSRKAFSIHLNLGFLPHFTGYLWQEHRVYLLLQKALAAFLFLGVEYLYPTDAYDARLYGVATLLVLSGYFTLLPRYQWFFSAYYEFIRNLPICTFRRLQWIVAGSFVFCLPDCVFMAANWPTAESYLYLIDNGLALILTATAWQLLAFTSRFWLLGVFLWHVLWLVLLMAGVPMAVPAGLFLAYATHVYSSSYWSARL